MTQIRKMLETDLPTVLAIEEATQLAPWSEETFRRCIELNYESWVLEKDGKILGFIIISFHIGETHVLNICIDPEYQHQGFGYALMQHILKQAEERKDGIIYLEVRKSNKKAIALYHKMGFVQICERKDYYPNINGREDALILAMDLGVLGNNWENNK